jgi:hypothetical protein
VPSTRAFSKSYRLAVDKDGEEASTSHEESFEEFTARYDISSSVLEPEHNSCPMPATARSISDTPGVAIEPWKSWQRPWRMFEADIDCFHIDSRRNSMACRMSSSSRYAAPPVPVSVTTLEEQATNLMISET